MQGEKEKMPETNNSECGEVKTYEPDDVLKKGLPAIFKGIFLEIGRNRWLTWQLFKRDFLATYKQSLFGVFWALIIPLISVGTFLVLERSGIMKVGNTEAPYVVFAVLGLAFWQLFSTGLIAAANSLVKAGSLIVKINFSKKSLVLASLGRSLVSGLIQLVLLFCLFLIYGYAPSWYIWLLPLLALPLFMLTTGLGFLLAILNGIVRDIGNALAIMLTFLLFLTPILYVKPPMGVMAVLSRYNILYYLIVVPRDLILKGYSGEFILYIICSVIAATVMLVSLVSFHIAETRVSERI
jgi:lipopolysaccharide transport system permease protein